MIHFDDGGHALGSADPQHRHCGRFRYRIAVQRDHLESVAGQRKAANLGGAAIQDMQQHAFAAPHLDRFAMTELLPVNGEQVVADFVAARHSELTTGIENLTATGAQAFDLDADSMTMQTIGVMQAFPSHASAAIYRARDLSPGSLPAASSLARSIARVRSMTRASPAQNV